MTTTKSTTNVLPFDSTVLRVAFAVALATTVLGCRGGSGSGNDASNDDANSGFDGSGDGPTESSADASGTTEGPDPGTDDGNPEPPGEGEELCDAGDEAYVKRLIPFLHGRRPESIREVRVLVDMIEQLDAMGEPGREIVARGLMRGEQYLDRWKTYLFDELRVNRVGDRRNDTCYDPVSAEANASDLAAFIRDNAPDADYPGGAFGMADVVYSALRLDDLTPAYRADVFARMSAPIVAGNVTQTQLEVMRRGNFGEIFETAYLGRRTECNQCHRGEFSVTYDADPELNRHWPIPGHFELAVYGPDAPEAEASRSHAVFRMRAFGCSQADVAGGCGLAGAEPAWGMMNECGMFDFPTGGTDAAINDAPYMVSNYADDLPPSGINATVFLLDRELRNGFEDLRDDGLQVAGDGTVEGPMAAAWLISANIANHTWREAMGYPLTVANNFPRNQAQRDIMQQLAEAFVGGGYSMRSLLAEIAGHPYFNQAPPSRCDASTPYNMAAVFDPFTKTATDPAARRNGVGDAIHRHDAWVLLGSIAQSLWWDKPQEFGPGTGQIPGENCGGNMPQTPCVESPERVEVMRDVGAFLGDSEGGFSGTDLVTLLRLEAEFGEGEDPQFDGQCTGPLGAACAADDWIVQLVDLAAATAGADMWDVAAAVKDRLITEPSIDTVSEAALLAQVMGVDDLATTVADVGAADAAEGARRLVGVLLNAPQFLLVGVAAADQPTTEDPSLVVPGTSTLALCDYLAPLVLDNSADGYTFTYSCNDDGITIGG